MSSKHFKTNMFVAENLLLAVSHISLYNCISQWIVQRREREQFWTVSPQRHWAVLEKKCCVSWAWLSDHHWGKVEKLCFNLDIGKVEREGSQMQFNYPPTKKTTWCLEVININNRLATAGWMFRVLSSDLYHPSKAKHCNCRVLKHPTVSHNSLPKKTCNLTRR